MVRRCSPYISSVDNLQCQAERNEGMEHGTQGRCSPSYALRCSFLFLCWLSLVAGTTVARAQTYTLLYSFQCGPGDGACPGAGLAIDGSGNLYGTTEAGGTYGDGTVFELSSAGLETVLHSFAGPPADGLVPLNAPLTLDHKGNLYGTVPFGGAYDNGVVFSLAADGTETILHNFSGSAGDGAEPYGGVVLDQSGDLYGAASRGGNGYGTLFKLTPAGTETRLYSFFPAFNGELPLGGLTRDSAGNFYGTTSEGGDFTDGTVFELSVTRKETVLLNLKAAGTGQNPFSAVLRDSAGNIYSTATLGGAFGEGTVFGLNHAGKSAVLHAFTGSPDGARPFSALVEDTAGNIYGTTLYGGLGSCAEAGDAGCGVIFKVTKAGQESVLYSFAGGSADGQYPLAGLVLDSAGSLYGTTSEGGAHGCGTVFKYTP